MPIRAEVWRSFYQDSMVLMRLAAQLRERPGVRQSAALMGTRANHQLFASAGLSRPDQAGASPGDLMLAVEAETDAAAEAALASARAVALLLERNPRLTAAEVRALLAATARPLPEAATASAVVVGLADACAPVAKLVAAACP